MVWKHEKGMNEIDDYKCTQHYVSGIVRHEGGVTCQCYSAPFAIVVGFHTAFLFGNVMNQSCIMPDVLHLAMPSMICLQQAGDSAKLYISGIVHCSITQERHLTV